MCPEYDYTCEKCDEPFSVIKTMREYDGLDQCPQCGNVGVRDYSHCKFHFTGTKVEEAEFNVGLGKVTKSKRHREELAKQIGAIEIGNERPEVIHQHFDSRREEKLNKAYDDL